MADHGRGRQLGRSSSSAHVCVWCRKVTRARVLRTCQRGVVLGVAAGARIG